MKIQKIRTNNAKTQAKLEEYLKLNTLHESFCESIVRQTLLPFANSLSPSQWIMYDGNTIHNSVHLLKQFDKLINNYSIKNLHKNLYEFFINRCGSIAHYNKDGWYNEYPSLEHLKAFFKCNEFGKKVGSYLPTWDFDSNLIINEMHYKLSKK